MELAAAEAAGNDMRTLRSIARKHIALADRGDIQAIRELADRLDGKPAQAVETSGEVAHRYVIEAPAQLTNEPGGRATARYRPARRLGRLAPSPASLG